MALLEHELAQAMLQYNLVLVAILEAAERERQRVRRRERRWWGREWIIRRPFFGQYETLIKELEAEHAADFKAFLRMGPGHICTMSCLTRSVLGRCPLNKT